MVALLLMLLLLCLMQRISGCSLLMQQVRRCISVAIWLTSPTRMLLHTKLLLCHGVKTDNIVKEWSVVKELYANLWLIPSCCRL